MAEHKGAAAVADPPRDAPTPVGDAPMDESSNIEGFLSQFDEPPATDAVPQAQVVDDPSDTVAPKKSTTGDETPQKRAPQKTAQEAKEQVDETADRDTSEEEKAEQQEEEAKKADEKPPKRGHASRKPLTDDQKKIKGLEQWNRELSHKVSEQQRLLEKINAKLDGTYEPPPEKTAEQVKSEAEFDALERVSRRNAIKEYGEEYVNETVYNPGSPYRELAKTQKWVAVRVDSSDDPTNEAILAVRQHDFFDRYGSDPDDIIEKITQEARTALLKEIKQEQSQKTGNGKPPVGERPPSISGMRTQREDSTKPVETAFSLDDVGNPGLAAINEEFR